MPTLELRYGKTIRPITIAGAHLGAVVTPPPVTPVPDIAALVTDSLRTPIGTPPLAKLVHPGERIVLIVDDHTRSTPVDKMLPPVLAELHAAGVTRQNMCIVVALGSHRPMTAQELRRKLGGAVCETYEVINLSNTDAPNLVDLGTASNGIRAFANRQVVAAQVRIGLGMITPHLDAGFSGGAKIVLPGVCGLATVDAFHGVPASTHTNQLGNEEAPLRRTLEEFVAERLPLDFIVNVIPTADGGIYRCVAGHAVAAQRAGVQYARQVFAAPIRQHYPVVVANCFPYDLDLWQSIKGVWAGDLVAAGGGTLVIVTAAPEGNSTYPLLPGYAGQNPELLRQAILDGQVADGMQAATGVMIGYLRRRVRLAIVSDGLTAADAAKMGAAYIASVEEAVDVALRRLAGHARQGAVAVLPQAGIVLPVMR